MGFNDWLYEKTGANYASQLGRGIANAFKDSDQKRGSKKTGVTIGGYPNMGSVPVIPGMTAQAPGGWDPNSRFKLDSTIEEGNTGDPAAPIGMDAFLASLMQPSAADSAAAAKAAQDQQALDYYAGNILGQISSGSYKQPYTDMSGALAKYLETATGNVNTAYDAADKAALAAQAANPYTNMVGTATEIDPGLMTLLQSQGLDTGATQLATAANRDAENQRVAAYNDMLKAMGLSYGSAAKQRIADVGTNRAATLSDLTSQNSAYGAQIASKQAEALQSLNDKLMESASKGANVTGQKKLAEKRAKAKADKAKGKK